MQLHVSEVRKENTDSASHDAGGVAPALSFGKSLRARRPLTPFFAPVRPPPHQTHVFNVKMNCGGCSTVRVYLQEIYTSARAHS
jgi:hypothetical protein